MDKEKTSLFSDKRGYINLLLERVTNSVLTFVFTKTMIIKCFCKGIKFGRKIVFYGSARIRRVPFSIISIGNNCRFRSAEYSNFAGLNRPCMISTLQKNAQITIGNNTGMSGTVIGCSNKISIGSNVLLGANTFITDTDWHPLKRSNGKDLTETKVNAVVIEDDVFIGLNTIILKGTYIGKGAVIGANSVVSGTIPANVIAAGNPCKIIKEL